MIRVGFSPEQKKVLLQVLDDLISDLRVEIGNTDNIVFKEQLRARKDTLGQIVEKLQETRSPQTSTRKTTRRKGATRKTSTRR